MRKLLSIICITIIALVLVGCQNDELQATATIENIAPLTSAFTFEVKLNDPENEIGESITIKVFNPNGAAVFDREFTDFDQLKQIEIANLLSETEYEIKIYVKTERKLISIGSAKVTTQSLATIEISTPQQFLAMGNQRSGTYKLVNDLDFTNLEFITPFSSAFTGTFDGQGYSLRNITMERILTYTGVFGYVSSGSIKDLVIENVSIGTQELPLTISTSSRVGIIAGYVSSSMASLDNITVKNSTIRYQTSSSVQAYVGGAVGDLGGEMKNISLENVDIHITSTSYGRIRIGGAVGYLSEEGVIKQIATDSNINFNLNGNSLKDRDFYINIGGVVGRNNAIFKTRPVENIYAIGDISVQLNFGTALDSKNKNYNVSVGGLIGFSNSNVINGFYQGSMEINHSKNTFEAEINKYFNIGGLIGTYDSNLINQSIVRLGDNQTMIIRIDDYKFLRVSQTFGQNISTATHIYGIYGQPHLNINDTDGTITDLSLVLTTLNQFFTSDWMNSVYQDLS